MTPDEAPFAGFGVSVSFDELEAALAVRGEVDLLTAPELDAVLTAVIGRGHRRVVLDLAELTFMDASGLRVIAHAVQLLAAAGGADGADGALTIRSPSTMVRRILDITGLTASVRMELTLAAVAHLGPEQSAAVPGEDIPTALSDVARYVRQMGAIPAHDDVVDGALRLVVALARATVGGADGVSVSLKRHGQLGTVAATDQTISEMDAGQYATGEGPCVDASVQGRWFHAESLDTETRWPAFTPGAQALGINAILSSPLLVGDQAVGALNIYSRTAAAFGPKDQELAAVFATEASSILTDAGVDVTDDGLAGRLSEALRARTIIAQAQGVLMERDGISEGDAFEALRSFSQHSSQPLRERAEAILTSTRPGAGSAAGGDPDD